MVHTSMTAANPQKGRRLAWLVFSAYSCAALGSLQADEPAIQSPVGPVLNLKGGDFVAGSLEDHDQPGVIRWKSPGFDSAFDFDRNQVQSIRFPLAGKLSKPTGSFGFELTGGDVFYGKIVSFDEKRAELEVARLGRVDVERSRLRRIFRWRDGTNLIYNGPDGLVGWKEIVPVKRPLPKNAQNVQNIQNVQIIQNLNGVVVQGRLIAPGAAGPVLEKPPVLPSTVALGPKWIEEGGQIQTNQDGVVIGTNLDLPVKANLEIDLSWKDTPDFILALGASDDVAAVDGSFRFEVWDGRLVVMRELEKKADVAVIQPIEAGQGRVQLQLYLDQEQGKLLVFSIGGELKAELVLGGHQGPWPSGVRLTNIHGDIRLERLRVGRWDGETPRPIDPNLSRVEAADHSTTRGQVVRLDAGSREFVVRSDSGVTRVAEDQVTNIFLGQPEEIKKAEVRAIYQDGTRVGGEWIKVEQGSVVLDSPGIAGSLRLPKDGLGSLEIVKKSDPPIEKSESTGSLELDGLRLAGRLVDSKGQAGIGSLAWQPIQSLNSSPIVAEASGRIVYKTPLPISRNAVASSSVVIQRQAAREQVLQRVVVQGNNMAGVLPDPMPRSSNQPSGPDRKTLYLRTGDIIPAEVVKIDENGLTIKTDVATNRFIPHARIKAVEMGPESPAAIRLSKTKVDRLLMLPRMQRESPPTQLIRSKNGDILRARILSMDDQTLKVEVRLEAKEIPRNRISRIIWLHADETDPTKKPTAPLETGFENRVQALKSDGIRLTFSAERFVDETLIGKSEVLGECKVRVKDVDQLLIGRAVEKAVTQLAYQNWKLQNAPDPRAMQDDEDSPGGGAGAGTESALVGKPAPDFELELLGGTKFHLADQKGKVIVLDFWATWCGPCLQAMPQIDRVTGEFAERGVQLIAVNLQETPEKIKALLERLKLAPSVVLDRDGVVAQRYAANAIPQTVVIDREGKITRLFIGGGPKLGDQLREALEELTPAIKK